ncbi:hypothetical protein QBC40DRAFT_15721 [Triangularia verruculosa]|uniref:Uncharacterized protein n=1 Tax=Triangularia verruculosa TaxID=2587418 RepID=A0AAN7AQN8_9PEZI|nr:hypothetical protein QBC40DRAFT_15721 [Triangularia verruculosa]
MDLDIEMDVDDVQEVPQHIPEAYTHDIITGEEQEPGEIDDILDEQNGDSPENLRVPTKVHIRGVDTLATDDVKGYLSEHYGLMDFHRVEWVNDTSANYIFKSESAAQSALISLAAVEIADPSQLSPLEMLPAKSFSQKPESNLQVRFAVAGDKKVQGAAAYSRFYLINPEYDPEERRRRGEFTRNKYRDRDERPRRRRRESRSEERNTFDVNLYDDNPKALSNRVTTSPRSRQRSRSVDSVEFRRERRARSRSRERPNRSKELFPERRRPTVGLRDRSASPVRDRDGDAMMDLEEDRRAVAAQRSRERGRELRERLSREGTTKDLFPSKASGKKELFPEKAGAGVGGKAQMDQVSNSSTLLASASLANRITTRPTASSTEGGLNIRGMAGKQGTGQGIAIKGTGAKVKELFPGKFGNSGNAGKELFAEKLEGRGRRRQRAEDSWS